MMRRFGVTRLFSCKCCSFNSGYVAGNLQYVALKTISILLAVGLEILAAAMPRHIRDKRRAVTYSGAMPTLNWRYSTIWRGW